MKFTKSIPMVLRVGVPLVALLLTAACSGTGHHEKRARAVVTGMTRLTFDSLADNAIPKGWKIEGTGQEGPLATWGAMADATAPSGGRVLAMQRPNHDSPATFNLCWTDRSSFRDGTITVRFKAMTGMEDQGGGVIWRAQDRNNYYIARFNPLEDNFRIYTVKDGVRRMLANAKVALPAGAWHTLKIVQKGNRFEGWLNGQKLLEGSNDVFTAPGGVGLWTKADAVTAFDDFEFVLE